MARKPFADRIKDYANARATDTIKLTNHAVSLGNALILEHDRLVANYRQAMKKVKDLEIELRRIKDNNDYE